MINETEQNLCYFGRDLIIISSSSITTSNSSYSKPILEHDTYCGKKILSWIRGIRSAWMERRPCNWNKNTRAGFTEKTLFPKGVKGVNHLGEEHPGKWTNQWSTVVHTGKLVFASGNEKERKKRKGSRGGLKLQQLLYFSFSDCLVPMEVFLIYDIFS